MTNGDPHADPYGGGAIFASVYFPFAQPNAAAAPVIVNNTFVCNGSGSGNPTSPSTFTKAANGCGGAIEIVDYAASSTNVVLLNDIFYGNLAGAGNSVAIALNTPVTLSYCDAYDNGLQSMSYDYWRVTPDATCSYGDPALYLELGGTWACPFWLQPAPTSSAARGTGTIPAQNPLVPTWDMNGKARPGPNGASDMGAYQCDSAPNPNQ